MILTIITLSFAAIVGVLAYIILIPYTFDVRKIPGPKPDSVCMGNFWQIRAAQPGDPQLEFANHFKDSGILRYYFWFNRPSVMVYGPNELKHVLVTKVSNYDSKPFGGIFWEKFFKEGLLMLEGDLHRRHRKMIQPAFNYASLKEMLPIFATKANAWCKLQQGKLVKDASKNLLEFDSEMSNLTLDVIGLCGFGVDFDAIADEKGFMAGLYKGLMKEMTLSFKLLIPFWYQIPLADNRKFVATANKLEQVIFDVIKGKRQHKLETAGKEQKQDLMDLLLDARDDETNTQMTDAQLNNHVMTFMAAGHETTSVALSWMFYALSQHPEVESKLYEEVKNVDFSSVTIDQLEQLTYLNNVVRETLRLYPPAAISSRSAKEDDEISGYRIAKGTRIVICPAVQHRLEKFWGPTANEFDPSRWDTQQVKDLPQYAFMPFLLGPRQCIGIKFALLEMKILSGIIMQSFTFKLQEGAQVKKKLFITMKPFPNLPLHIYQRK